MGVDYSSKFGIGVELRLDQDFKKIPESEKEHDFYDKLELLCEYAKDKYNIDVDHEEFGAYNYGGDRGHILCIDNPFNVDGSFNVKLWNEFCKFIVRYDIKYNELGLVGGLHMY